MPDSLSLGKEPMPVKSEVRDLGLYNFSTFNFHNTLAHNPLAYRTETENFSFTRE